MEPEEHSDDIFDNLDETGTDLEGNGCDQGGYTSKFVRGVGTDSSEVDLNPGIRVDTMWKG